MKAYSRLEKDVIILDLNLHINQKKYGESERRRSYGAERVEEILRKIEEDGYSAVFGDAFHNWKNMDYVSDIKKVRRAH